MTFSKLTLLKLKVAIADDFVWDAHQNNVLVQFKPEMNQFLRSLLTFTCINHEKILETFTEYYHDFEAVFQYKSIGQTHSRALVSI